MAEDGAVANTTIMRMVNNYKGRGSHVRIFDYNTPTKRPASPTTSTDGSEPSEPTTSVKKFKADNSMICAGSPREYRKLRCDLIESRNYTKELEKQLTQMRAMRVEEQIVYERETKRWKSQAERDRKSVEELEARVDTYKKRGFDCNTELNEVKIEFARYRNKTNAEMQELESQYNKMKEEAHNQTNEENGTIIKLERQLKELEIMYNASKNDIKAQKEYVEGLTSQLKNQTTLQNELELKTNALNKALQQIKKFEFTKESIYEFQQQSKAQQHKITNYDVLERENAHLREEHYNLKQSIQNKLLMEEEVNDLKGRLIKYKEQEKKLNTLMVIHAQTEMHLEEFRSLARGICETSNSDPSLPRLLRAVVERLQRQELTLTSAKIQLDSSLSTVTHEANVAKDELSKCREHIGTLDMDIKIAKTQLARMHRKLQLVTGERDSYRKQLDSYEKDLTICVNPASLATPGAGQMQSQHERIQSLEENVEKYRDYVLKLENELKNVEGFSGDVPIRAEQLARLQNDITRLRNENMLLRDRKDKLEIQLEEYFIGEDRAKGRIIHNSKNPLSNLIKQRETEKERLEEEVVNLKRKVKKLEEGQEVSRLGDITIDHKEVQALKEEIAKAEKNNEQIVESYSKKIQELRDVTYLLFGYKLDVSHNSRYKLISMYAERPIDQLCFKMNKGSLSLMENEYSASLFDMVELHLTKHKSIPVFLSSITLDLFNNKSMTYEVEDTDDDEEEEEDVDEEDDDDEDPQEEETFRIVDE